MRLGLFLIFVAVPLLEIALLIKVGTWVGFWPAFGLVVVTAIGGSFILHRQGMQAFQRMMREAERGRPPVAPVVDGAFIVLAGALLISPGLITDTLGLLLLVPPVRRAIAGFALRRFLGSAAIDVTVFKSQTGPRRGPEQDGSVIDGEYERLDERDAPGSRPPDRRRPGDRT